MNALVSLPKLCLQGRKLLNQAAAADRNANSPQTLPFDCKCTDLLDVTRELKVFRVEEFNSRAFINNCPMVDDLRKYCKLETIVCKFMKFKCFIIIYKELSFLSLILEFSATIICKWKMRALENKLEEGKEVKKKKREVELDLFEESLNYIVENVSTFFPKRDFLQFERCSNVFGPYGALLPIQRVAKILPNALGGTFLKASLHR